MLNERLLNLLSLCVQAKERGHDCFYSYSPHVGSVEIDVFLNGWVRGVSRDAYFIMSANGNSHIGYTSVNEVENYLKGLIAR